MPVFHARPAEIEAWPYDGSKECREKLLELLSKDGQVIIDSVAHLMVNTNSGWVELFPKYYLMNSGVDYYPCDPITFAKRWCEGPIPPDREF